MAKLFARLCRVARRISQPIRSERGSAILMVFIFAAVLLALAPIYSEMIKNSANQNAQNRAAMGKRLIMQNIEAMLTSPAALRASLDLSTSIVPGVSGGINTCLRMCLRGVAEDVSVDPPLTCLDTQEVYDYYNGLSHHRKFCQSYTSPDPNVPLVAAWHPLSLFSPAELVYTGAVVTGGTVIAGHRQDEQYPNPEQGAAITGTYYNYDGTLCQMAAAQCPLEVFAYFHPLCPGDTLLEATPSTTGHVAPPNTPFPMSCNQAVAIQVAYEIKRNPAYTGREIRAFAEYDSRRDPVTPLTVRPLTELPIVPVFPAQQGSILPTSEVLPQVVDIMGSHVGWADTWPRKGYCAKFSNGTVQCWSNGSSAGSSTAIKEANNIPQKITFVGNETPSQMMAGSQHQCFITGASSRMQCRGRGTEGQLGNGGTADSDPPVVVQYDPGTGVVDFDSVTALGPGYQSTCAVRGGLAYCWGGINSQSRPTLVSGPTNVTHICAGQFHACARESSGVIQCWGSSNGSGQLGRGLGDPDPTTLPKPITNTAVFGGSPPQDVFCASSSTCTRLLDGQVFCWGANTNSVLGRSFFGIYSQPTLPVQGLVDAQFIFGGQGALSFCAGRSAGTYRCWGLDSGTFADGSSADPASGTGTYGPSATPWSTSRMTKLILSSSSGGGCALESLATGHTLVHCTGRLSRGLGGAGSMIAPTDDTAAGSVLTIKYPVGPWIP